jgi:hypothetical protein
MYPLIMEEKVGFFKGESCEAGKRRGGATGQHDAGGRQKKSVGERNKGASVSERNYPALRRDNRRLF